MNANERSSHRRPQAEFNKLLAEDSHAEPFKSVLMFIWACVCVCVCLCEISEASEHLKSVLRFEGKFST